MTGPRHDGTAKQAKVLSALAAAASRGEACPTNAQLADLLHMISTSSACGIVTALERRGLIKVERFGAARQVTIVATGKATSRPANARPHWRLRPQTGEAVSGADLVGAIRAKASELGQSVRQFAAPLSPDVAKWLSQTEQAVTPKPHTIERVRALLAGELVEPPPANNFQKSPRSEPIHQADRSPRGADIPAPIDRDPCPRCAVRADIGCHHRPVARLHV